MVTSEVEYSTSGNVISTTGVQGSNVISFNSVAGGSFLSPSSFSLGEFLVASLPVGVSTTYTETPFEINLFAEKINGVELDSNDTPIKLTGVLNGTMSGPNQSSVVATFDPLPAAEFRTGDFLNTLTLVRLGAAGTLQQQRRPHDGSGPDSVAVLADRSGS